MIKNGALLPTPFHQFTVDTSGERGLIGLAFHPDFANNGYVYVHYTATTPSAHNRISRLVANGDVSTGAETVIVDLPTCRVAHPQRRRDPLRPRRQALCGGRRQRQGRPTRRTSRSVFGKMLRFNDDGTIPTDNPFYGSQTGLARAVWAYGLRNPFTFAFQPGTGRMHINDVGERTWEEINLGAAGANYGWPGVRGTRSCHGRHHRAPVHLHHYAANPPGSGPGGFLVGAAIVGGAFYPPAATSPRRTATATSSPTTSLDGSDGSTR